MKKQYTKKQIQEAIAYWEKQLKMMNEDNEGILSSTEKLSSMEKACEIGADCIMRMCENVIKRKQPSNIDGRYVFEDNVVKLSVGPVQSENYLRDMRQFYLGLASREYGALKSFVELFDNSNCPKPRGEGRNAYVVVKAGDYSGVYEKDGTIYEFDVQIKCDCKWA